MEATLWYLIAGAVFIVMALSVTRLKRLPLTTSMLYLLVGIGVGPAGLGLLRIDAFAWSRVLEHVAEVAVIVSLFTAGLKLRVPLRDERWGVPVLLATVSMLLSVALVAVAGAWWLGLPLGAAVLLGAVLAPTDPVLASDVQLQDPTDRDRLRFALTGEAGLNDGTAFPFVMLGVGLLGLHDLGRGAWRWFAVDLGWAVTGGLGIGWLMGLLVGRAVLYLRRRRREAVGTDDFLALGLIALAYGAALLCHAYGFLAVFAAGLALRNVEMHDSGERLPPQPRGADDDPDVIATDPRHAPAQMARAVLEFNEQLERIGEVVVVVIVGAMLWRGYFDTRAAWFVLLLLVVIRPAATVPLLAATGTTRARRWLVGWFGIRGIGSIYYLMYAINRGIEEGLAERMIGLVLAVVAVSIVAHGISVTPLMNLYRRAASRRRGGNDAAAEPAPAHPRQ